MSIDSLLDIAKSLKDQPKPQRKTGNKADQDYVVPTTTEMIRELADLFALTELVEPKAFQLPAKPNKKSMLALLADLDPADKVSERATVRRLLKAKKVTVPDLCSTSDMVLLAMTNGCFGRDNTRRAKEATAMPPRKKR